MKAKVKLSAKVGGVQYNVSAGEVIPPALAEFYAANKAVDSLIRTGAIEPDHAPISDDKTIAGNPIGTRSVKKD